MSIQETDHQGVSEISRGQTLLFAVAGGAAVGNLYWAQPLLSEIAKTFTISAGMVGFLITATQVGYALGILLIVPLGDTLNRRRLIPIVMMCSALALMACAVSPTFVSLLLSLVAVGLTTVAGQILTPLAGDLALPAERGRVVGTVVSGLITGILLSRTISGFLSHAFGWRAVYAVAAALIVFLALVLAKALPREKLRPKVRYAALLISVFTVVRDHRSAQITLVIGALAFAVFTMFWTGLTFLLSSPPFSYSVSQIGLVGLVGLAGALAAQRAGWLHDRGWSVNGSGAALAFALMSLSIAGLGSTHILPILIAVLLLDIAIQATNVLNQTRLLAIDPNSRSRLNTAFVVGNFIGGAVGSMLAGLLWESGGWPYIVSGGAVLIAVALAVWVAQRGALIAK